MTKVKVLIKGFIDMDKMKAWPTITLILDGKKKIITDPGTVKNQKIITDALKQEGLGVNDITHVFITHSHLDHYRNLGMFPNSIAIDIRGEWNKDRYKPIERPNHFHKSDVGNFTKNIHIIKTVGHDESSLSFFINGETIFDEKIVSGMIAICGDVFRRENFPSVEEEPFATDKVKLKKSRELIMNNAEYVIPGHDDIFKTEK